MFNKSLILILILYSISSAQPGDEINKIFIQAIEDYKESNLTDALKNFNKIASEYQLNSKTTISLLLEGKINLELKNYSNAEINLLQLLNNFPRTKYSDEANIILSKVYLDQQKYKDSFWRLCLILSDSELSEAKGYARTKAEEIALSYLSASEVKSIYDSTNLSAVKPFLLMMNGKIHLHRKNDRLAQEAFAKLIRTFPDSFERKEAQELYDKTLLPRKTLVKPDIVGVVLPLTSNPSLVSAASEILEGIKFALSEFNEGRDRKVGILIRDSELSRNKLEEINTELKNVEVLKCVVGPVYSSEVKDALEVFDDLNLPIISPTATDDYLTESNNNFFQANPSFSARGRLMAQYVYFVGNKRKIAILNAVDGYSPILSSSFTQEFERLGGKIILRESYRSGSADLKEQMKRISDVSNILEAIYIPLADRTDIPIIVSNLSQLNLNAPIYGDQDWINLGGLETASFLENNIIFCSDYFLKYDDREYQTFAKNFYSKTNIDVNRNVLYGYDTMKYLLTMMRTSFSDADALKQKMISGINSVGFHNNICFDPNRINRYMNIVHYTNGKFELLDKFKLNN